MLKILRSLKLRVLPQVITLVAVTLLISVSFVLGAHAENTSNNYKACNETKQRMNKYAREALDSKKDITSEYKDEVNKIAQDTRENIAQRKDDVLSVKRKAFSNMNNYTGKSEIFGKSFDLEGDAQRKLVFISLSMNEKNLEQIIREAKLYGFTPVLRGFKDGSYIKTTKVLSSIITKTGSGVVIDPESFKEFNIKAVPTFVVAQGKACLLEDKCAAVKYNMLSGNVTFDYVLNLFESQGDKL